MIGGGPIGLSTAQVAKAYGASEVMLTELSEYKRKLAERLGIDHVVDPRELDPAKAVRKLLHPDGADVIFECVGSNKVTINQAISMARKGARIVVVGVFGEPVPVNVGFIQDWELEVVGTAVYTYKDFLDAIELIRLGKVELEPYISKIFPLDDVASAFKYIEENRDTTIKVLLKIS